MQDFQPTASSKGHKLSITTAIVSILIAATCLVLWDHFGPNPGSNRPLPSTLLGELFETRAQIVCVVIGFFALLCFVFSVGVAITTRGK